MYIVIPGYVSTSGVSTTGYAWVRAIHLDGASRSGWCEVWIHPSAAAGDAMLEPLERRTYRLGEYGMPDYDTLVQMLGPAWDGVKYVLAQALMATGSMPGATLQ